LLHAEHEAKIEEMIRKHGFKVFFLSRFMVGIRAPVYLTAGVLRMSFRRFMLIDACCATAVVGLFFGLSYAYGERVATWLRRSEIGFTVLVVAAGVAVGLYFLWRRYRHRPLDPPGDPCEVVSVGADDSSDVR
jgi:membrane protein DedA with SNARE-associated domain